MSVRLSLLDQWNLMTAELTPAQKQALHSKFSLVMSRWGAATPDEQRAMLNHLRQWVAIIQRNAAAPRSMVAVSPSTRSSGMYATDFESDTNPIVSESPDEFMESYADSATKFNVKYVVMVGVALGLVGLIYWQGRK